MPRIRSIHPEACDSEKLSLLSASAERTFFRLLTHTDDDGRGEDRPKLLAAKLYPLHDDVDADTVDADLDAIAGVGLMVRYAVGGKRFYAIPTFQEWQSPRHPRPSKYPAPEEGNAVSPEDDSTVTADRGTITALRRKPPAGVGVGGGSGEGEEHVATAGAVPDGPDPEEQFDRFWEQYPRHAKNGKPGGGGDRKPTLRTWKRMSQKQRDAAMAALPNYRAWCESPEGEFPKHAQTWLNAESWEQWQTPAETVVRPTVTRQDPVAAKFGAGAR